MNVPYHTIRKWIQNEKENKFKSIEKQSKKANKICPKFQENEEELQTDFDFKRSQGRK